MAEKKTLEVWLAVDPDGDFGSGSNAEKAAEDYQFNWNVVTPLRIMKLNVTMTLPDWIEADVTVPDEAGQVVTAEAS